MISITQPILAPTGLSANLVSGGTLDINTTYYYRIYASDDYRHINPQYLSECTAEGSITTDNSNRSIQLSWNAVSGAVRYSVLLTKVSGEYYSKQINGGSALNHTTDQTTFTVTSENYTSLNCHLIQLKDSLIPVGLTSNIPSIKIELTGNATHSLQEIYEQAISQGLDKSIYYNKSVFSLNGTFRIKPTGGDAITLVEKNVVFFIFNGYFYDETSGNSEVVLGEISPDGKTKNGCHFYTATTRPVLKFQNTTKVYGCSLHQIPVPSTAYKYGGGNVYLSGYTTNLVDFHSEFGLRDVYSEVNRIYLFGGRANYQPNFTVKNSCLKGYFFLRYEKDFYRNNFYYGEENYIFRSFSDKTCCFYDCNFHDTNGNLIEKPNYYSQTTYNRIDGYYKSLKMKIVDKTGTPIIGATITIKDKNNNNITAKVVVGDGENSVAGSDVSSPFTSDSQGRIDIYVKVFSYSEMTETFTDYYPFTITVDKDQYLTYTAGGLITKDFLDEKLVSLTKLEPPVINNFSTDKSNIQAGEGITLSWNVSNASLVSINEGVGTVNSVDTITLNPTDTTTYILTATNNDGKVIDSQKIVVSMPMTYFEDTIECQIKEYDEITIELENF